MRELVADAAQQEDDATPLTDGMCTCGLYRRVCWAWSRLLTALAITRAAVARSGVPRWRCGLSGRVVSYLPRKLAPMTEQVAPNELVVRESSAPVAPTVASSFGLPQNITEQMQLAELVAQSDLVPKQLQGKPANVFMIVQKAVGLGISFDLAVSQCHVIDNKVSPSAELLRILLHRAGHHLEIYEHSDKVAKARLTLAHRRDKPIPMEYSIAKAQAAGLTNKPVWKQHAESMLVAAVTRLLVRFHCPEVAAGLSLDVEMTGVEFGGGDGHAAAGPGDANERAREILAEAMAATDTATLTQLGKDARNEKLLDQTVGDGATLKKALMQRLHELESTPAN